MHYLGGKARLAGRIAEVLARARGGRLMVEPFSGALNVTAACAGFGERLASDVNPYLFSLWSALRAGWVPPEVSEDDYRRVASGTRPVEALTTFVGYACAFGGKWFGGFARAHKEDRSYSYSDTGRRACLKKMAACASATLACCSYDRLRIGSDHLVYCDPPYANTTGYSAVGAFDSPRFWDVMRTWTREGARVLVSEYAAPADWESVWEAPAHRGQFGAGKTERLFAPRERDWLL